MIDRSLSATLRHSRILERRKRRSKTILTELLDTLLTGYQKSENLIGESGLLKQLTKALVERALEAETTEHLGYVKHEPVTPIKLGLTMPVPKQVIFHPLCRESCNGPLHPVVLGMD